MDFNNVKLTIRTICLGLMLSLFTASAWAVHDNGVFELDGNAYNDGLAVDDWENVYLNTDSANVTLFKADPAPQSIFDGGKKDIQDIPKWSWKDGSVPDKDNITNAYAAAYGVKNAADIEQLIIYFGADRFANVGDAFLGFWFFQDEVAAMPNGDFSGVHKEGDVLILVNYPQGANDVPYIAVILWDTTCSKAASNSPLPGECAAANLRLKLESDGAHPAECNAAGAGDLACATTNQSDEPSPWPYTPKAGDPNVFPYESIYEGGINISELLGADICFSSFMAESRSSSSFTASLKDFVLGSFKLCGIELTKQCPTGTIQSDGETILYDYKLTVKNTGFGTLYDINATDITAGNEIPNGAYMFSQDSLAANQSVTFTGSFYSKTNKIHNFAEVTAAVTSGGNVTVTADDDVDCPQLTPDGGMYVTKACDALVAENVDGVYGLRVNYTGKVCSTSNYNIENVAVLEEHDGVSTPLASIDLLTPGSCVDYSGSYVPVPGTDMAEGPIPATDVRTFADTLSANGDFVLDGSSVSAIPTEASCDLCE